MKKPFEKRIRKEIKGIEENPIHNEIIELEEENNFNKIIVTLPGPEGTKYENQNYEIHVEGFIFCRGCGFASDIFLDKSFAIQAWNRRVNDG